MRNFITILLLLPLMALGQSESHVFTTYDTTFSSTLGNGEAWQARISRPTNLFTPGSPDTAWRPLIIMMPGQGQMGSSNPALLTQYGPHYWLANGWDGSVILGNGAHYPIIITIAATTNVYPQPYQFYPVLLYILQHYHINPHAVYGTGLSEGSFTIGGIIDYEQTVGDQAGMKLFTAIFPFEGTPTTPWGSFPPTVYSGCSANWCDTSYYKTWATTYGGRYFYLEGSGSDNFRDGWHYAAAMNNSVPKSAYFSYESDGGGAHCCWNDFFNPSVNQWSTPTGGTYTSGSQAGTDQMGNYRPGTNVYQWAMEQGDTTLVGSGATPPIVSAGSPQTITLPTSSVVLSGSASAVSPATSVTLLWTKISGPGATTITGNTTLTPTMSGLQQGSYVFQLQATDNNGNANTSLVTITVTVTPAACIAYYWDTTNINIALTNANYATIHPCDTIYVDPCKTQAGYRSLAIKLTSATPWKYSTLDSNRINLIFRNAATYGTIKSNTGGNLFANSIDASANLLIKGLKMSNHTDPLFSTVTATGYLHHIKFVQDTLQHMPGLWGSGPITTSLANFTGANDTVNCNFDLWFHQCVFDSIGNTTNGGLTTLWLGGLLKNQVFVKTEVDSCFFDYAPSPTGSGAACFIHCQQCIGIKIHGNKFSNLGVVTNPQGHAATTFMQMSLFHVYNNFFGDSLFANCTRAISFATVPAMSTLLAGWGYDGISRFHNNILRHGRKYPMIEMQKDTIGMNGLTYLQPMRSAHVWNNTMYRGGTGAGNSPYNVSLVDWYLVAYTTDTLELHNNIEIGPPTDTVGTMTSSQATVALVTKPNNGTPFTDSSGNQFYQLMTFATSGLADTNFFYPAIGGLMFNNGVAVPSWLTKDFYGQPVPATGRAPFARNTGVDVGAVQYTNGAIPPTVSAGADSTITLPTSTCHLIGAATGNGGATISVTSWTQVSGPGTATIAGAGSLTTAISGLVPGGYVFQLSGTDSNGNTSTNTVRVTVNAAPPAQCNCITSPVKIIFH